MERQRIWSDKSKKLATSPILHGQLNALCVELNVSLSKTLAASDATM